MVDAGWLLHVTGGDNGSGPWYLEESGFVGAVEGITGLAGIGILLRVVNCHADGCKRLGFHHVHGTSFRTCRRHHPTGGNTVKQIHEAHRRGTDRH